MRKLLRKIQKETKGAVTVFITLLLIPAILVSGTAVDLARIFTARSILQDANQLAANTVLTQYNALLYDLYGLFGVAKDDPILGKLLDDYIKVTVFGEQAQDRGLGTLQVFYGSDIMLEEPEPNDELTLDNRIVLRRQIEEYMKFRGPVLIVKEIIEALDNNTLKADKEIIDSKTDIDNDIVELFHKYKELYEAIEAADKLKLPIGGISGSNFGTVSSHLELIQAQFVDLRECYEEWESAVRAEDEYMMSDCAARYSAILENIKSYVLGGRKGSNWSGGRWRSTSAVTGLVDHIERAKQNGENFKPKFDTVVSIAREVDAMHSELSRKVDELENKLNSSDCNEELKNAFTTPSGTPPMSLIERYRDILKWDDVTGMATVFKDGGIDYIDNVFKPMLDGVRYRNGNNPSAATLSRDELTNLGGLYGFELSEWVSAAHSKVAYFAGFPVKSVTYGMPDGFKKFAEQPGDNKAFFEALTAFVKQPPLDPVKLYEEQEEAEGKDAQEKQGNLISALLELVNTAYTGLTNNPLGAKYVEDSFAPDEEKLGILEIMKLIPKAITEPVVKVFEDPLGSVAKAGEYILLLTYCTSTHSNYATSRPESIGKTKDELSGIKLHKSVTGIPMSPKSNYFFQSEWEYLHHGSNNASANLSAITRLLFLVRLICNYITAFSVPEITTIVTSIQTAFAWFPPLGLALGELARAAFAAAETVVDVAALRSGHKVPLFKKPSAGEWVCSPKGVLTAVNRVIAGGTADGELFKSEKGMSYSQYMLIFFVTKAIFYIGKYTDATDELFIRTMHLIEWNMVNCKDGINSEEEKMTEALANPDRFMLSKMTTGIRITTTANVRMLFLSMVFAQKGIDGVVPPRTIPITTTEYRGY